MLPMISKTFLNNKYSLKYLHIFKYCLHWSFTCLRWPLSTLTIGKTCISNSLLNFHLHIYKAFKYPCIGNLSISVFVLSIVLTYYRHHRNIQSCKERKFQTKVGDIMDHLFSIKCGQNLMHITWSKK